ncbi:MAG: hypothetical protein QW840_00485 [Candidatus Bathyarchaeia archaeon]
MKIRNRNKPKKVNLLELSDAERYTILREIRNSLQQKAAEAKLWQSFIESDSLQINGKNLTINETQLDGLHVKAELLKSI